MPMKLKHTKEEFESEVPESINPRELYSEQNGAMVFTGIPGIKTDDDISRLQTSLTKEREATKAAKEKLKAWGDLDPEDVFPKLDRFAELEVMVGKDKEEIEAKLEEMAKRRAETQMAPVQRQMKLLEEERAQLIAERDKLAGEKRDRFIEDHLRTAATAAKIRPEALPDMLLLGKAVFEIPEGEEGILTRENLYGVSQGLTPEVFFSEMQEQRPHWWPSNVGGNAGGSQGAGIGGGKNPFSHDHWNMTEQGKLYSADPSKAKQMAQLAGTTVGGPKPQPKK